MRHFMVPYRLLAALVLFAFSFVAVRLPAGEPKSSPPAAKKPAVQAEKKGTKEKLADPFMRVGRDDKGQPLAMETAVTSYVPADGNKPGVTVDLVGAVHVGDRG